MTFGVSLANDINLDAIVKDANKTNKHILVYLHPPGCPYCDKMQEFTFDDETIIKAIQKDFLFVDINVKDKGTVTYNNIKVKKLPFAKETGHAMYPSCLFYDKNGELVYDSMGYRDEDTFLKILKSVRTKSYNEIE